MRRNCPAGVFVYLEHRPAFGRHLPLTDAIKLTVPHARRYYGVVRLVVGGLAARLELSYEYLEDVQLAIESLIANEAYVSGGEITVEVHVEGDVVHVLVGPLDAAKLEPDFAPRDDAGAGVGLRRLLTTVAEDVELERRDGGQWVRFRKRLPERPVGTAT